MSFITQSTPQRPRTFVNLCFLLQPNTLIRCNPFGMVFAKEPSVPCCGERNAKTTPTPSGSGYLFPFLTVNIFHTLLLGKHGEFFSHNGDLYSF